MKIKITLLIITLCLVFSCQNSSKNESTLQNLKYGNAPTANNSNSYGSNSTEIERKNIENNSSQKTQYKDESINRKTDNYPKPKSSVKYYTNSFGERVQSPTHYQTIPSGATAQCRDGTFSFSRNRRGTCSRHGGVSNWLK